MRRHAARRQPLGKSGDRGSLARAAGGEVADALREVWGASHTEQSHYLRIYMGHLRQKLEHDPAQPRHLLTETAVGYRLQVEG